MSTRGSGGLKTTGSPGGGLTPTGESGDGGITADKIAKIHKDLDVVRNNMTVFSEMLLEIQPGGQGNNPQDLELIQELYKTCKEMQMRLAQLLYTPTNDQLTVDMIQINDDLNDLFDRYDRKTAGIKPQRTEMPLIDLGDESTTPSLLSDLKAMNISPGVKVNPAAKVAPSTTTTTSVGGAGAAAATTTNTTDGLDDKEFEKFISSRQAAASGPPSDAPSDSRLPDRGHNEEEIIQGHRETDFEEMEAWLKANPGTADASLMSIPNPQFDNYLAERVQSSQKDGNSSNN